jgi:hypothetical protein
MEQLITKPLFFEQNFLQVTELYSSNIYSLSGPEDKIIAAS